jgi:hypothetical protein
MRFFFFLFNSLLRAFFVTADTSCNVRKKVPRGGGKKKEKIKNTKSGKWKNDRNWEGRNMGK